MGRALRRIRELDSRSEDIAGHSLSVICGEEYRLEVPNGESLERALRTHIGPSLVGYIQKKKNWVETVGYESTTGLFNFTVLPDSLHGASLLEDLVDLSLGLREPLAISSGEILDVRFDIPAREPLRRFSGGEIDIIRKPVDKVEVVLRLGTSVVRLRMDMLLPFGLGDVIETELFKILFKSKFFDFLVCHSRMSISSHIPGSEHREGLCDLYDLARVVLLFGEASRLGEGVEINIRSGEAMLLRRKLDVRESIALELLELAATIRDAWEISKRLEIHERVNVSLADLVIQKERLNLFRAFLAAEASVVKFGFFDGPGLRYEGQRVFFPLGTEVMLGDYRGTVVVSMWGDVRCMSRAEEGASEYVIVSSERKLERVFATEKDEEPSMSLSAAANAVADAYNDVPCLLLPQFVMSP